ncbi:LysR family transcriptional regulator [Vibrio sp. NTOU-M3]|uniref:LysR family transcriptional regulator n=1 Tax=Vibrio sp. NTOU-M3 TaxID=3234954 RepID=UPI00349F44E4
MKNNNLNLLRTLQILLEECHVSHAAERLHLTQSAVSRQLNQLRELFDDQLLVREKNHLVPTPRAEQLKGRLDGVLTECDQLFEPEVFEPAGWKGQVAIASSDHVAQYFMPDLVDKLGEEAPDLNVVYHSWSPKKYEHLGELDIQLVSSTLPKPPDGLSGMLIGEDHPVCVMNTNHPLAKSVTLDLDSFLNFNHVSVVGGGDKDSFVDQWLSEQGLSRRIQFTVPFFSSALSAVCRRELLLVIPEHVAISVKQSFPITYFPMPFRVPKQKYWLIWHPKYDNDASHKWFRETVLGVMQSSFCLRAMVNQ